MVSQKEFKEHFWNLFNSKAVYIWGGNCEILTKQVVDKLFNTYGSSTYNRAYYDGKLAEGAGRIGADCSGAFLPLSGGDNTAKEYYNACTKKGKIGDIPKGIACMVFNANLTHVGAYMGDGTTIEMKNSTENVHKEQFNASRWAYYGIPAWLDTTIVAERVEADTDPGVPLERVEAEYISNGVNYALVFDPVYYSDKYPDLKKAFGTDAKKLFNHFIQFGMKEARQACKNFNVGFYKSAYTDLQKAFGNNLPEYYKHYIQYGHREGRITIAPETPKTIYRVQVGAYSSKANAENVVAALKKHGYKDVFVVEQK